MGEILLGMGHPLLKTKMLSCPACSQGPMIKEGGCHVLTHNDCPEPDDRAARSTAFCELCEQVLPWDEGQADHFPNGNYSPCVNSMIYKTQRWIELAVMFTSFLNYTGAAMLMLYKPPKDAVRFGLLMLDMGKFVNVYAITCHKHTYREAYMIWILNSFSHNLKFKSLLFVEVVGCALVYVTSARPKIKPDHVWWLRLWCGVCFFGVSVIPALWMSRPLMNWTWIMVVACMSLPFMRRVVPEVATKDN